MKASQFVDALPTALSHLKRCADREDDTSATAREVRRALDIAWVAAARWRIEVNGGLDEAPEPEGAGSDMPYPKFWQWGAVWPIVLALMLGAVALGAELLQAWPPHRFFGQAEVLDAGTLRVDGSLLRIDGIEAPRIGLTCRNDAGHRVEAGRLAAAEARRLIGDGAVTCKALFGGDAMPAARCSLSGRDLSLTLIDAGAAWAGAPGFGTLKDHEDAARRARRGLWALDCAQGSSGHVFS